MEENCIQWRMVKKAQTGPTQTAIVSPIKAKPLSLKHGSFAYSIFKNSLDWYQSRQYLDDLAVAMKLKRDSTLPPALGEDDFQSCAPSLMTLSG